MFSSFISRPVLRSLSFTTGRGFANNVANRKKNSSLQLSRILNEVDALVKNTGRVPTRHFLSGLNEMMQPETEVTPIQALLMLRCCGSLLQEETTESRNELAEKTWLALIDRDVRLDISHYNALLRIYLENSKQFDPLQFLDDLQAKNIQPNRVTYQRIIHHFCSSGQMETVAKVLLMLKENNVPLTDTIFNSLLMGYIKIGDMNGYKSTIQMMNDRQIEPGDEAYTTILSAAAEMSSSNPELSNLFNEVLNEVLEKKIYLSDQQKLKIATNIPESNHELFEKVISMCNRNEDYNTDCYNAILELVNLKKIDFALKLLKTMLRSTSSHFQSGFFMVRQMVKTGIDPTKVIETCDRLKKDGLNDYALNVAVESAFDHQDLETSKLYLKHFIQESDEKVGRPHYYWPLLTKCSSDSQVLDVLLNDMVSMDKLSQARSILETFEEYVWTKNIRDPLLFFEQLKPANYPTSLVLTSLVNHLIRDGRFDDALGALNKNKQLFVHPRYIGSNLGVTFAKKGDVGEFAALVKKLRSMSVDPQDESWIGNCLMRYVSSGGHNRVPIKNVINRLQGVPIPTSVLDTIKSENLLEDPEIQSLTTSDSFSYIKPSNTDALRNDTEALENHLIELKSRGLDTRGCLRKLILAYCRKPMKNGSNSVVERVEELMTDLTSQEFTTSPAINASLMDMYANNGKPDKALELMKDIPNSFIIDSFKIIDLATALIKKNMTNEAISLIQEQLQVERPPREWNAESVERNVFKILNTAAEVTRDPKLVSKLLELVLPLANVTKPTNVMMGPMVKVHLLNDNFKGALDEFAHAASTYRITPWRAELMKRAVEKDDPVSLQLLTDITIKIFGEPNALVDVALAFLSGGKSQQVKRVIAHPAFSKAEKYVLQRAERLVVTNEINILEKFVDSIVQSSCGIEKEPLLFQMIRGYVMKNDHEKALDVWTKMQENEVIPSPRTLKYLGSFLKESGSHVPFDYSNLERKSSLKQDNSQKRNNKEKNGDSYAASVNNGDLDEVLLQRQNFLKEGKPPSVSAEGALILRLIDSDRYKEAVEIFQSLIEKGLFPPPRIIRHLVMALNKHGEVETMEELRPKLPEQFTNQSWYTNQLAYCFITAGKEEKLVNEIIPTLNPPPLSAILTVLQSRPEFEPKILEIADLALKNDNHTLIHNIIWSHRMISRRFEDAQDMLKKVPQLKDSLLFQTLISKIRLEKDIELADSLALMLQDTNLIGRKLAEVHSAKIDALIEMDRIEDAENHLMDVVATAKTKTAKVKLDDMKRMTLVRLRQKLIEVLDREPKFEIPRKGLKNEDVDSKQRMVDSL